jgi:hypothetical protein
VPTIQARSVLSLPAQSRNTILTGSQGEEPHFGRDVASYLAQLCQPCFPGAGSMFIRAIATCRFDQIPTCAAEGLRDQRLALRIIKSVAASLIHIGGFYELEFFHYCTRASCTRILRWSASTSTINTSGCGTRWALHGASGTGYKVYRDGLAQFIRFVYRRDMNNL